MKKLCKSTKTKLLVLVCSLFVTGNLWASPVVLVNSVKGNVFALENGNTRTLAPGETLKDFGEIITEEGSQVTFSDYYDHQFHLAGSGHIKILNRDVELKRGYLWIQSYKRDKEFGIQTANAVLKYQFGEAILSFESTEGKTQLLVIHGDFNFANLLQTQLSEVVREGQFSFVMDKFDDGAPRKATSVGYNSFQKVTYLFDGVTPMFKDQNNSGIVAEVTHSPQRAIASVGATNEKAPGKIIYLNKRRGARVPASFNLDNFYNDKIKNKPVRVHKKFAPNYRKESSVEVQVFGKPSHTPKRKPTSVKRESEVYREPAKSNRTPASMVELNPQVDIAESGFEKDLVGEYKKQMRHSNEINKLISELKNYDQDYKTKY